ncbi:MAG: hypothetical protein CW691_10435 [Candidatus Bathyarchaeum sp.]|nr:MAG: hypothetical protein CW691_10435 [Candidatus Bathyarchaeum sp.]
MRWNALNIKLVFHFAKILALSSVRARRTQDSVPTGFAKSPKINLIIGAVGFVVAAVLVALFAGNILEALGAGMFMFQIAIFLPALMTLASVMYGLLFEFSQSSSVGSSDVINWLPIHPAEFVLASVFSMLYFLAPIIGIVFGATLGLALTASMLDVGLFTMIVSCIGLFLGAFSLEIIRAITNRVSSSVYKRTGRSAIIIRMVVFVLMFVVYMLLSNVNFLFSILDQYMNGIQSAWFIPILWPSLTIMSYMTTEVLQVIVYLLLSVVFTAALLWAGVKLREKYWVPAPFALKVTSTKDYAPKQGILGRFGFTSAEAALLKKDFRGLTRRKEMLVWIAVPIGISVISFFSTPSSLADSATTFDRLSLFWGPLMGLFMFAFYITITSIGQEGSAFLNLRMIPLNGKEVIRAKLSTALIPSSLAMVVVTVLIQIMLQLRPEALVALAVTLFAAVFECAFVGVALGCRYPDFTEVPRARFIDQKGVWLGMILIAASICVTFLPLFLYGFSILAFPVIIAAIPAAVAGILICYVSYHSSLNSLQSLVTQN